MGRRAAALKSKSSSGVALPHDGPINSYFSNRQSLTSLFTVDHDQDDIVGALSLISPPSLDTTNCTESSDTFWNFTRSLCETLCSTESIKIQLQTLQKYRSTLLNWLQQNVMIDTLLGTRNQSTAAGLYRLLLEWSLSVNTPVPLQRAIQSNLKTLATLDTVDQRTICKSVLESLWAQDCHWRDRLHSLDVALNFPDSLAILQSTCFDSCVCYLYHEWLDVEQNASDQDRALHIAKLLKLVLQDNRAMDQPIPFCSELETMVLSLMKSSTLPNEAFNTLGILYAKLYLSTKLPTDDSSSARQIMSNTAVLAVQGLQAEMDSASNAGPESRLSLLARLSIVQGIASILDPETLLFPVSTLNDQGACTPLETCWKYVLQASNVSTEPMTRLAALKGLSTLANRWKQHCVIGITDHSSSNHSSVYNTLIQETLDSVLEAWENPPLRKLGTVILGIFETLVKLLPEAKLHDLCRTVFDQPLNRKGRYLALEILLPYFPITQKTSLLKADSLLEGVGDRGPNSGPIADLWIKLLGHVWNENDKKKETLDKSFEHWTMQWIPSFSQALVDGDRSRRKQVAAFCLPRLFDWIKRTELLQDRLSECIELIATQISTTNGIGSLESTPIAEETLDDRILWAQLELARQCYIHKLMTARIQAAISMHIPPVRLSNALVHELGALRLVAFQSLEAMVNGVYGKEIIEEAEMWKKSMYCSTRVAEHKDYTMNMMQCLTNFLDRFSAWETNHAADSPVPLPKFYSFAVDFILGDLVIKQGAYPGTIADKEEFSLIVLENLLTFILQDQAYTTDNCVARHGVALTRKRENSENVTMTAVLRRLCQQEVFASLFALLNSSWDSTRSVAFRVLSKLVVASHAHGSILPTAYGEDVGLYQIKSRGFYLASSPRQREADTGARLLAYACICKNSTVQQLKAMKDLASNLEVRLADMSSCLESFLSGDAQVMSALDHGKRLPLAHGIIRAILLTIQHQSNFASTLHEADTAETMKTLLFEHLIRIFCEAIQLSLKVVADVREGECIDGMEEYIVENNKSSSTPLNVNTGAIGANGSFARLSGHIAIEQDSRLGLQRVVVGTWLLTKETCGAVSAIMATQGFHPSPVLVETCGSLFISTLISLKHAGAAFAARDALQEIARMCLQSKNNELQKIPERWVNRLLEEIGSADKVRDSTLRRSTGYALGFVALMRAALATRSIFSALCDRILRQLIRYSLPAETALKNTFGAKMTSTSGQRLNLANVFVFSQDSDEYNAIPDLEYETRCRVHALNVLKMIILDAPLYSAVASFMGDCIISSLLGYSDPAWSVRNSATMVFSAAMLRAIDADKNASNNDRTSSQAITLTELFRRYPSLSNFLPEMMKNCLRDHDKQVHSQLFPILLLLSRTQPVAISGSSSVTETYPDIIFSGLNNGHHAIRAAAPRSLANLCSGDVYNFHSSTRLILTRCVTLLLEMDGGIANDWNQVDGLLVAIKAILTSFNTGTNFLRDLGLHSFLNRITRLHMPKQQYPPSCISTALDILVQLVDSPLEREELLSRCLEISLNNRVEDMTGGSLLYFSSTMAAIYLMEAELWMPNNLDDFAKCLASLRSLFMSGPLDVRIIAVKSFKKRIYRNIDAVVMQSDGSVTSALLLSKVAGVFLECLKVELSRTSTTPRKCLGPHIPTVRRLSRCFLECFDGYQHIPTGSVIDFVKTVQASDDLLWSSAMDMVEHENFLGDEGPRSKGEIFLSGNAAELMAIQVAADLSCGRVVDTRLKDFVEIIRRLNDPQGSWRSRYSAIKAVETSTLLAVPQEFGHRGALLVIVTEMLQDSDSDVRKCAARATQQVQNWIGGGDEDSQPLSRLPIPTLCRLYTMLYRAPAHEQGTLVDLLAGHLKSMMDDARSLLPTIMALDEELEQTRNVVDLSLLTNSSAKRKIFEEEDPNPYLERILRDQLGIQTLLCMSADNLDNKDWSWTIPNLVELLTQVMVVLRKSTVLDGGIIHDLSRHPVVFPTLYSLLGVVTAFLYLGLCSKETAESLKQEATTLFDGSTSTIHPTIFTLLECLAQAEKGSEATKAVLQDSLFLL